MDDVFIFYALLPFAFFFMITVELGTSLFGPKFCPGVFPQYSSPTVVIDLEAKATEAALYIEGQDICSFGCFDINYKRRLLIERKVMTNLDSILKSRDITLPIKVCLVKAMVFSVVMYG